MHWTVILCEMCTVAHAKLCNHLLQVVVRSGRAIAAVPPDYKLLDYDFEKRVYLYADTQLTNDSFLENQGGMCKVRDALACAEDCAELKSYPDNPQVHNSAKDVESLVRGLSVVLPSESVSWPTPSYLSPSTASVRSLRSQSHSMLHALICYHPMRQGCSSEEGNFSDL
jgi:hypothetical protein